MKINNTGKELKDKRVENINKLSEDELINKIAALIDETVDVSGNVDEIARVVCKRDLREVAKKQGDTALFDDIYKGLVKQDKKANKKVYNNQPYSGNINFVMDGKYPMKIKDNMNVLLDHKGISVKYNEMTKRLEFTGIEHDESVSDSTFTNIKDICTINDFKVSKDQTYDFIQAIGVKNKYNPIADFLNECKEISCVGTDEIDKLLTTIHYDTNDKDRVDFYNKMLLKWLLGCIDIGFNTLEYMRSLEFILTFKGVQGLGKTRWVNSFVPSKLYKDGVTLNLEKTDSIMQATKYWIVELGEIGSTFKKSDIDKLKGFITTKTDEYRSPYGRSSCIYPRRTAFIGTVNDEEFLRDKTGNRRFVVLPVSSIDYINDVDSVKLWGQLMHVYESKISNKEPLYMTKAEQAINDMYNVGYVKKNSTEIALDDLFDWDSEQLGACTVSMIVDHLRNSGIMCKAIEVQNILSSKGLKSERMYAGIGGNKKRGRFYKLPYVAELTLPF